MKNYSEEFSNINILAFAELLGTIDHKVRGIQQLIIALKELSDNKSLIDSLNQMMKGLQELQGMYNKFLNIRMIEEEKLRANEAFMNKLNLSSTCNGVLRIDIDKLKFIHDTIRDFGREDCKVSSNSSENGCIVRFSSPVFSKIPDDKLKFVPEDINLLPLFAARKITEKMDGTFHITNNEIIIEFPYFQDKSVY